MAPAGKKSFLHPWLHHILFQDSFIEYNKTESLREYKKFLDSEGAIDVKIDSQKRKGWTNVPFGLPHGVVVTHAAINTCSGIISLVAKINL